MYTRYIVEPSSDNMQELFLMQALLDLQLQKRHHSSPPAVTVISNIELFSGVPVIQPVQ